MPANSAVVVPTFARSMMVMAAAAVRTPKRSRIRETSPFPVVIPSRGPASWVTRGRRASAQEPQELIAGLGADHGVGGDALGVVVGGSRDEPRSEDGQERHQRAAPAEGADRPPAVFARRARAGAGVPGRRARPPRGPMRSMTSSTVMTPTSCSSESTTGTARRLYFMMASTISSLPSSTFTDTGSSSMNAPTRRRFGGDQLPQGHLPDELVLRVGDVQVVGVLLLGGVVAEALAHRGRRSRWRRPSGTRSS